ncbi:hypothetical protein SKAU_G00045760 [Synaphobranchus kaupii]|uniref:Uncharacterized protein n=1 Tax=Synaphobranchus kaupii TaxID=118154 RepID=A0A9Q1J865_SYNKA|nr:hypothetical protein SKAU_G00045760 [Synaphobranchus kaupii]
MSTACGHISRDPVRIQEQRMRFPAARPLVYCFPESLPQANATLFWPRKAVLRAFLMTREESLLSDLSRSWQGCRVTLSRLDVIPALPPISWKHCKHGHVGCYCALLVALVHDIYSVQPHGLQGLFSVRRETAASRRPAPVAAISRHQSTGEPPQTAQ